MNILLVGSNETSKQYIHAIKDKNTKISMIEPDEEINNKIEDIEYYNNISELTTPLLLDLIIICKEYSTIKDDVDKLLSFSNPIIWDSEFVNDTRDIQSIHEIAKNRHTKLLLVSQSRFSPQVVDIYENIDKGRIGKLGVVNMKRHSPISSVSSHQHDLQSELEALYPYAYQIKNVFGMSRKYHNNHYMTIILKLDTDSIINIEVYTGNTEFNRSGEFTGNKGVLNYSSELQTMVLKKTNQSLRKWTPTVLNPYINIIEYAQTKVFDLKKVENYLNIHEQLLVIKEAVLRSAAIGAPVNLKEDVSSCIR